MEGQLSFFDFVSKPVGENKLFSIGDKKIRLIELFAGIGSQAMALRDLGKHPK